MFRSGTVIVATDNYSLLGSLRGFAFPHKFIRVGTKFFDIDLAAILHGNSPDLAIFDIPDFSENSLKQILSIRQSLDIPVLLVDSSNIRHNTINLLELKNDSLQNTAVALNEFMEQVDQVILKNKTSRYLNEDEKENSSRLEPARSPASGGF